jgi:hypothetical protein
LGNDGQTLGSDVWRWSDMCRSKPHPDTSYLSAVLYRRDGPSMTRRWDLWVAILARQYLTKAHGSGGDETRPKPQLDHGLQTRSIFWMDCGLRIIRHVKRRGKRYNTNRLLIAKWPKPTNTMPVHSFRYADESWKATLRPTLGASLSSVRSYVYYHPSNKSS